MAFTPDASFPGTGFEQGSILIVPSADVNNVDRVSISTTSVKTGTYALLLHDDPASWMRFAVSGSPSDYYVSVWCYPYEVFGTDQAMRIYVYLSDGNTVGVRIDTTGYWDAFVGNTNVASGTIQTNNAWHHVQLHVIIADAGTIETKIDGISDISYSGDTKPGAVTDIDYVYLYGGDQFDDSVYDDLSLGTGGWPGDIRYEALLPNADTATEQWDLSAGADSYALVDEVPPDDADYIYTGTDAKDTVVALADWDGTNKTPQFTTAWVRAWKDEAAGHQVAVIDSDGTVTNVGSFQDLLTSATYLKKLMTTAPGGGAWTDADADNLQIGVRSNIV